AAPSITVIEGLEARRLVIDDRGVSGVLAAGRREACLLPTRRVVLATGGVGGLYAQTTNPLGAIGQGLALAARAGAALVDMEFVQFHPTALDVGLDPMPLVSEAVRGEGAVLTDETGTRFMAGKGRAELEPRDVVARAVAAHIAAGHRAFLDAREALGAAFATRFPAITTVAAPRASTPRPSRFPCGPRRTTTWVAWAGMRPVARAWRACGPAARWRRAACTAPIAWPAIRCWRRWSMQVSSPTAWAALSPCRLHHGRRLCHRHPMPSR